MKSKVALICGISGQDGAYLAKFLLSKGYEVWGSSRDAHGNSFLNLKKLDIKSKIKIISMVPEDFRSVLLTVKNSRANEIYYLAGQSSVSLSFEQPAETIQSFVLGTLNILEAVRMTDKSIKIYNAGSSECFGDTNGLRANEETSFNPKSPYAVAKASAYWLVNNYRESYNLFACTGILFNHESPLRPERFVTKKIISTAIEIYKGLSYNLELGRLDISRDWGWAPEFVEAMYLMLQQKHPEDFVIATGETNSLEDFVKVAFEYFDLNYKTFVSKNNEFIRPSEILINAADTSKATKILKWQANNKMKDVIKMMIEQSSLKV